MSQDVSLVQRMRGVLPRGNTLPDAEWRRRHRILLWILWAHVVALPLFGLTQGFSVLTCVGCAALIAAFAIVCTIGRKQRSWWVMATMSVGLLTCSAVLIAFWHGQIEAHFHFFVVIVLLTLYEEWLPFLIAAAYVALHHGILGVLDPKDVYNHHSAAQHPWAWAAVHAGFVLAAGVAALVAWRLNEDVRDEANRSLRRAVAAEHALAGSAAELKHYAAELERSNNELTHFASVASHDLSEPLRTITGFMRLLEQRYDEQLDDRGREFIGHALSGADRMQRLIDGLLTWSKVGRTPLPDTRVELDTIARGAVEALGARIAETGATVTIGALPSVRGDADQLDQMLQNLISNAMKFARPGETPRVEVDSRKTSRGWAIVVADHGIGIPAEQRAKVFQMFHRLHGLDSYDGAGMGLAIVERVVEHHGGDVEIEETPGGGATFVLTLPSATREPVPVVIAG
jgi:signal transduction histidine kinase